MSDLEQRLADALTEGAQDAPPALGLAAAARSRARTRRRNRIAGAAAVVALAVGVPTAVVATGGSDGHPERPSDRTIASDPAAPGQLLPAGYHYESWHDVTIEVPDGWQYGALDQWCAADDTSDAPQVQRPGGAQTLVLCSPAWGLGVRFAPSEGHDVEWPVAEQNSDSWPAGAFVGATTLGGVVVTVAAPDASLALDVLGSAQRNPALDPNGCPVDSASDPVVPGDSMTVCRYDDSGQLEQSELLSGDDVARAEEALEEAPEAEPLDCTVANLPGAQVVRLSSVAEDAEINVGCGWLTVHGEARELTSDVLYWALSPGWSGSVPGDVSLPPELR